MNDRIPRIRKWRNIQKATWDWFDAELATMRRPDVLLWMGDSIDGRGERSGGTELITLDRNLQVDMALDVIERINAKNVVMVYGTPYHTGAEEDWEDQLAHHAKADKIGAHEWVTVNGVTFDMKHKVGSSQIPHGRHTAVARESLWNSMWAEADLQPKADIVIRGHVHYYSPAARVVGNRMKWAITLPALQAMGTKYGSRQCSGLVDFGFVSWLIQENGRVPCPLEHLAPIKAQKAKALVL